MKTPVSKKPAHKAATRTGPSQRTPAEREAINKRAAAWRKPGKKASKTVLGTSAGFAAAVHALHPKKKPAKPKHVISIAGQPTRFIREIKVGARHRKEMGDLAGLAKSIDERGALLQPIVITSDNELIAGQRRMGAWALSKFRREPIPVCIVDIDSIIAGEWDENAQRKDFTPSECVAIKRELEPIARAAARERQRAHGGSAPGRKAGATAGKGNSADHLARYLGKSRTTIDKAEQIVAAVERDPKNPELMKLKDYMNRTGKVNGPFKRLQVLTQVADINTRKANGTLAVPEGSFDRIVADIPWPYEPEDETPAERGRAVRQYATISIKEAKALPIAERCADNCVLYFWVTNFHMEYGYQVLRAWGFTQFPVILTWVKTDGFGRGKRLRNSTEHVIVAIKGKPLWNLTDQTTHFCAPTTGVDSQKPPLFYEIIDAITPAERSLELFARRTLPEGWVGYGDQVGTLKDEKAAVIEDALELTELDILTNIEADLPIASYGPWVKEQKLARGSVKLKLTKAGIARLKKLQEESTESWENPFLQPDPPVTDDLPESIRRGPDGLAPYQRAKEAAE